VAPGEQAGDDGGAYRWRVKVSPSAVAQAPGDAPPVTTHLTLYDVEVAISWTDSGHRREVVLHSQRLASQQGAPNG
jgi:hypothetical protein